MLFSYQWYLLCPAEVPEDAQGAESHYDDDFEDAEEEEEGETLGATGSQARSTAPGSAGSGGSGSGDEADNAAEGTLTGAASAGTTMGAMRAQMKRVLGITEDSKLIAAALPELTTCIHLNVDVHAFDVYQSHV